MRPGYETLRKRMCGPFFIRLSYATSMEKIEDGMKRLRRFLMG